MKDTVEVAIACITAAFHGSLDDFDILLGQLNNTDLLELTTWLAFSHANAIRELGRYSKVPALDLLQGYALLFALSQAKGQPPTQDGREF